MHMHHHSPKRGVSILARNKFSNKLVFIANPRILAETKFRDIYSGPLGGGGFFVQIEKQEEFEGGLHEKKEGKGGKRREK